MEEELNSLIEKGANVEEIQRVSLLLDECLVEYYSEKLKKE